MGILWPIVSSTFSKSTLMLESSEELEYALPRKHHCKWTIFYKFWCFDAFIHSICMPAVSMSPMENCCTVSCTRRTNEMSDRWTEMGISLTYSAQRKKVSNSSGSRVMMEVMLRLTKNPVHKEESESGLALQICTASFARKGVWSTKVLLEFLWGVKTHLDYWTLHGSAPGGVFLWYIHAPRVTTWGRSATFTMAGQEKGVKSMVWA